MPEESSSAQPRAFISYSHDDRDTAQALAELLRSKGIDAWFDQWEIKPGDSLIEKIFEEGLKDCRLFLMLLSPASVRSSWVRHELDAAVIQKLAGVTRVVPIVVEPCEIPVALRPLLRLDMQRLGMDAVVEQLVDVAFKRSVKPKTGPPPSGLDVSVGGLSNHAARITLLLSEAMDQPDGSPLALSGGEIQNRLTLSPQQVNDAVEELEALGLVKTLKWLGTAPFLFGQVEPTASLPLQLRGTGALTYDPEEDIRLVAAAVAQHGSLDGPRIQKATDLPPSRINRAVSYLEDYGIVQVRKVLGTAPFHFRELIATGVTRRFLVQNSRK